MSRSSRHNSEDNQAQTQHLLSQGFDEPAVEENLIPPYSSPLARRARTQSDAANRGDKQDSDLSPENNRGAFSTSGGVSFEHETPSGKTDTSSASYREISWATMFGHLLDRQDKGEDFVDKCSITYLGEAFPLSILLNLDGRGRHPQLHHPGPPYTVNEEVVEPQSLQHPPYMRPEDIAYLEAKRAFELPDKATLEILVGVFLDRVFPLYPIVIRQEFLEQHRSRRMPWLLIHASCFMAATFCPLAALYRCGFQGRRQARWAFYGKAKALFDIGYEENKIVLLQASIMMTFWGGGPNNYWNFYSWISAGVTIAETLGCHRSMDGANIRPHDRSLLKRLWWVLMIRDTGCAALVGRPFRISLDHCDSEPLTGADFQHDLEPADGAGGPGAPPPLFGLYQMEATKLSLILRRIITTRYYPNNRGDADPESLERLLADWQAQLPPQLRWPDAASEFSNIFASTLSVLHSHSMILAHLNCSPEAGAQVQAGPDAQQPRGGDVLIPAAQRIAAAACTVVTRADMLTAPHELLHGIFTAAVVFYIHRASRNPLAAQLGASGLTNCQMVLHESWDFWDSSSWIAQLFDKVPCSPSAAERGPAAEEVQGLQGVGEYLDNPGAVQGGDLLDQGYDMWHVHPVLGSLFDVNPGAPVLPMGPNLGEWLEPQPDFAP